MAFLKERGVSLVEVVNSYGVKLFVSVFVEVKLKAKSCSFWNVTLFHKTFKGFIKQNIIVERGRLTFYITFDGASALPSAGGCLV